MNEPDEPQVRRPIRALVAVFGFGAVLAAAVTGLPHAELPAAAREAMTGSLPKLKLSEPVNAVVYSARGFDTFGETFLLLAAILSVVVLTRGPEWRHDYFGEEEEGEREQVSIGPVDGLAEARRAESEEQRGGGPMPVPVRVVARLVTPFLAVAGLYLVAWGYAPGGGFPAGAVLLGVVLLVYVAFGRAKVARVVRPAVAETLELAGAALIILLFLGGLFEGSFGANWLPLAAPETIRSGGVAQAFSVAELVEVGTGLVIAVFSMIGMGHEWDDR